jgi:hypothetical protein
MKTENKNEEENRDKGVRKRYGRVIPGRPENKCSARDERS